MSKFKKILSLVLAVCMLASIVSVAAVTASANAGDAQHRALVTDVVNSEPENQVETNTYYFYLPQSWRNEYNDYYNYNPETKDFTGEGGYFAAGIYWWEGPYNCNDYKGDFEKGWIGYAVNETLPEDANIFKANVPKDADKFIWHNLVDGGQDKNNPVFYASLMTENISNEYYDPGEDGYGFYPEGTDSFDGMIYVCDPKATEENVLTPGKYTYKGAWFYYYGNGEYGIQKTREEAEAANGIYKNGKFPSYGLDIDVKEATIAGGETVDITPNNSTAKATVADEAIASVSQDETGKATITGLKAGTTKVTFTVDKNGKIDTVEATITVTSDAPTQPTQSSDYTYSILEDGTVEITKYYGSAEELEIPSELNGKKVTSIGEKAFFYCDTLKSIKIPDIVNRIGSCAFAACFNLESVKIPDNKYLRFFELRYDYENQTGEYETNGREIFEGCSNLKYVDLGESITELPEKIFSGTGLKSITIPDSVINIRNSAFFCCKNLESITIPDSVTTVGGYAFNGCTSLKDINIPDSVNKIGSSAFAGCTNLESVKLSTNKLLSFFIDSYKDGFIVNMNESKNYSGVFEGCLNLKNVDLGESITELSEKMFSGCIDLESITIPDSVMNIGNYTFSECTKLEGIVIPDGVTSIGDYAFTGCTSLTSITIPDNVTSIGVSAFQGCTSLTDISIPDSVNRMGSYAFADCTKLVKVKFPDNKQLTSFGEFYYATEGSSIFESCSSLKNVNLGNNITKLYMKMFYNCNGLENIVIPKSVQSIGPQAFWNCINLKSITILNPDCEINSAYETISGTATIYGYANSTAYIYALNCNRNFVEIKSDDDPIIPTPTTEPLSEETEATKTTSDVTEPITTEPISTNPVVTNPIDTEPITPPVVTDPTQPSVPKPTLPKVTAKKNDPIKVSVKTKTVKAKKLKKKAQKVKPLTIKNAKGKVTVTLIKKGTASKIYKKIKINRKTGAVTLKKGKYKRGKYKIKLSIKASGNSAYYAKTITKTVTIKIK